MNRKNTKKHTMANAIIWAALIIASSLLMPDSRQWMTMLFLLIGGWLATQSLLDGSAAFSGTECSFLRRLFRRPTA